MVWGKTRCWCRTAADDGAANTTCPSDDVLPGWTAGEAVSREGVWGGLLDPEEGGGVIKMAVAYRVKRRVG